MAGLWETKGAAGPVVTDAAESAFKGIPITSQSVTVSDCYIGRKKCGCAVAAIVIDGDSRNPWAWKREVANTVAEWIRDGLSIERATVEAVRGGLLTMCECAGPKDRSKQAELALGSPRCPPSRYQLTRSTST